MIVSPSDAKDFFRIIKDIDLFFTKRLRLLKDVTLEQIQKQRGVGFSKPQHVKAYIQANPLNLPESDLEAIDAWQKHGISSRFLIHKERSDGCLMTRAEPDVESDLVYLVKGLTQPIGEIVPFMPCFATFRLLPFRGHIITDGIVGAMPVMIGRSMASGFATELRQKLAAGNLVTTLPAGTVTAPDPAELLKRYFSTAASRRENAQQIQSLRAQSPELNCLYLAESGRLFAKTAKAQFKAKGITGHFAVLEDTVVTGAPDKADAERLAKILVPKSLHDAIIWISLKANK